MKFEKRAVGGEAPNETPETHETGKKPVIVYILILFLAAFLLMFLSLLAHQRSNTEALGRLQSSMTAIEGIQATQEQIIDLQKQLDETEKALDNALEDAAGKEEDIAALEQENRALLALYRLQQEYLSEDLDGCKLTLQEISDNELAELLPDTAPEGITPPSQRYQELKEAVLNPTRPDDK